ncbi:MAG: ATP-binding protein [Bacteroidales bacterium]|nr:ATP-binding protein [Bacteroidales bacterium]
MDDKNPFLIYGYQGPEYFCDREDETNALCSALTNGRNVTLMSTRRMGKTGLIFNTFHQLNEKEPSIKCFYIDIFSTNSLKGFIQLLAQAILGQLDTISEKWLNRLSEFFKSCRPKIATDPFSGTPTVTLDIQPDQAETTLKEIFAYLTHSGKECVIAIDEFQQISEYPEKGTEALIRSYIQFMPNVHFIFSGSKRHIMNEMFSSPKRPFYQSTQKMNIDSIDQKKYYQFAAAHLKSKGITMPEEVFSKIYSSLYGHTWYIQRVLNKIYEIGQSPVSEANVDEVMRMIINEEEYNFQKLYSMLTANQQQLLQAVAAEGTVKAINSSEFIQKYQLKATSSVNRALAYLLDNEFILDNLDGYQVYDRFMALWLRNKRLG